MVTLGRTQRLGNKGTRADQVGPGDCLVLLVVRESEALRAQSPPKSDLTQWASLVLVTDHGHWGLLKCDNSEKCKQVGECHSKSQLC